MRFCSSTSHNQVAPAGSGIWRQGERKPLQNDRRACYFLDACDGCKRNSLNLQCGSVPISARSRSLLHTTVSVSIQCSKCDAIARTLPASILHLSPGILAPTTRCSALTPVAPLTTAEHAMHSCVHPWLQCSVVQLLVRNCNGCLNSASRQRNHRRPARRGGCLQLWHGAGPSSALEIGLLKRCAPKADTGRVFSCILARGRSARKP